MSEEMKPNTVITVDFADLMDYQTSRKLFWLDRWASGDDEIHRLFNFNSL